MTSKSFVGMGLLAAQLFFSVMQDVMQDDERIDKQRRRNCVILCMYFVSLGNWPRHNRSCVLLVEVGVVSREKWIRALLCKV